MGESPERSAAVPAYRDRGTALIIAGVVLVLLGAVCLVSVPMTLLAPLAGRPGSSWPIAIGTASIYFLFAVTFVWLGIGSALCRRWARTLALMVSWIWLIAGVVSFGLMVVLVPRMSSLMLQVQGADLEPEVGAVLPAVVTAFVLVFMGFANVVLPGVLILFYRSRNVIATVEARDPNLAWTERRERPVVVLSLSHAVLAYFFVFNGLTYDWTVPLFGTLATGWTGAVLLLASAAVSAYLAWSLYDRKVEAWWIALALTSVWTASFVVTFWRIPIFEYYAATYRAMDIPEETLSLFSEMGELDTAVIASTVAFVAAYVGYLIYAKRFYGVRS